MWLGIKEDINDMTNDRALTLDPDDTLLLYTDCIIDSQDRKLNFFFKTETVFTFQGERGRTG